MDYIFNIETLNGKKNNINTIKKTSEEAYNDYDKIHNGLSNTEISGISGKVKQYMDRLKNGTANSSSWYEDYLTKLSNLEESLANFDVINLSEPIEFKGEFIDMFGRVTMPVLKTGGDVHINATKAQPLSNTITESVTGGILLNGSIIDTTNPVGTGTKYNITPEEIAYLAHVAKREQGSVEGAKLELSLMVNLYEKNKHKYKDVTDYVRHSGWFSKKVTNSYTYPGEKYVAVAQEVINGGNRYLPSNVVEHDCLSDIKSISTGNPRNRADYIPGKTIIYNRYGAKYVFQGFAPNGGDPFGNLV